MIGVGVGLVGAAVLLATFVDMVTTVLRVETHSGPLTQAVTRTTWRLFRPLTRQKAHAPDVIGIVLTLLVVSMWLLLTFAGWYLIFSASPSAVVGSSTGDPANAWARAYYTAYVISTLGIGDYVPGGPLWQVLTGVAATAGFALATLVLTYLGSLTTAVAHKRRFARTVTQLGTSPQDIVARAWDGDGFAALGDHLIGLTPELNALTEQHMTYPVLYFFRTGDPAAAHWPSVAMLHDTVLILDDLVEQRVRLPALVVEPARAAIAAYVQSVPLLIDPPGDEPPPPPLDGLRSAGVPLRPTAQTDSAILRAAPTRRAVAGVLSHQGWAWPL